VKRRLVWTRGARDEYLSIIRHVADENPGAAERVADRIDRVATALADFATGRAGRVSGTYEKVLADLPYILAYEITALQEGGEVVAILHIIHGARDWPAGQWPQE
jgi:toxin ParE1/3/4